MKQFLNNVIFNLVIISTINCQLYKDCDDPLVLCGESPFRVEVTDGEGNTDSQIQNSCLFTEINSTWIEVNIKSDGDFVFEIIPDSIHFDLDFLVFKIENNDCEMKEQVRCMASGITIGQDSISNSNCLGNTGLAYGEIDTQEVGGCSVNDNNFLAPLQVIKDDKYHIMINYFSMSSNGFEINFGGTASIDCITSQTSESQQLKEQFKIENNSTTEKIAVQINPEIHKGELFLSTISGQLLESRKVGQHKNIKFERPSSNGIYIVTLSTDKSIVSRKVFVYN